MVTGTLTRRSAILPIEGQTLDSDSSEVETPEEHLRQQLLESQHDLRLHFKRYNSYYADSDYFQSISNSYSYGTNSPDWGTVHHEHLSIWDSPKFIELLSQPLGSPIELTLEEADEIVRLAAGRLPDLPSGIEYTREVRELLGRSIIDRLEKSE